MSNRTMTSLPSRVLRVCALVLTAALMASMATPAEARGRGDGRDGRDGRDRGGWGAPCRNGYVALTFDDGPNGTTEQILRTLRRSRAKATFFAVGANAWNQQETVRSIARAGMPIGNHSYDHAFLDLLTYDAVYNQLLGTNQIIGAITGTVPTMFRPPYGRLAPEHAPIVTELGMYEVLWTIDTSDWRATSAQEIVDVALTARDGDIVLMHDLPLTAQALPSILSGLERRGLCTGRIVPSAEPVVAWEGRTFFARAAR